MKTSITGMLTWMGVGYPTRSQPTQRATGDQDMLKAGEMVFLREEHIQYQMVLVVKTYVQIL